MTLAELEEHQRQQEERERRYQEEVRLRRMEIDAQFTDAYTTHRAIERYDLSWANLNTLDYHPFFDVPSRTFDVSPPQPTETSLHERFNAAVQEASRCAQRGDTLGRVASTRMANDLRQQILQQTLSTI